MALLGATTGTGATRRSWLLGASRSFHLGRVKVFVLGIGLIRVEVFQHPLAFANHCGGGAVRIRSISDPGTGEIMTMS